MIHGAYQYCIEYHMTVHQSHYSTWPKTSSPPGSAAWRRTVSPTQYLGGKALKLSTLYYPLKESFPRWSAIGRCPFQVVWPGSQVQLYSDWCTVHLDSYLGQANCVCHKSQQKHHSVLHFAHRATTLPLFFHKQSIHSQIYKKKNEGK